MLLSCGGVLCIAVPGTVPSSGSYDWAIGCSVHLKTTLGEDIQGTVFAFDRLTNCLTLQEEGDSPDLINFRVVKATFIKQVVSASSSSTESNVHLPYVDIPKAPQSDRHKETSEKDSPMDDRASEDAKESNGTDENLSPRDPPESTWRGNWGIAFQPDSTASSV